MINLDKYLDQAIEFQLGGESIHVKQPSARVTKQIAKLESEINNENYLTTRCEITSLILNANTENKTFTKTEIDKIPFKVQDIIAQEVAVMKFTADNDPN